MSKLELFTEDQAAAELRISPRTLRGIRKAGGIRYVALSARKIAYRPEDCAEYVESRLRQVDPQATRPPPKRRRGSGKVIPFSQQVG